MTKDQRRHERFAITSVAVITLQTADGETRSFTGNVFNISLSGMGLCASEAAASGDRVQALLCFVDADGISREEGVEGTVMWQKAMSPYHILGIEFDALTLSDHPGLYRSLKDKAQWMASGTP
jgi:hypothetical protein